MGKWNVLVTGVPYGCQDARPDGTWLTDAQRDRIQAVSNDIELYHPAASALNDGLDVPPPHAILVETSGAEASWESLPAVLFGAPLQRLLTPQLEFLQSASAGVEHLIPILPPGTILCNASGVHANAIAETVLAVMLSRSKLLAQRREDQRDRLWRQLPCRELAGATMCVVGTGDIGTEVARLAQAFGIDTSGVRRRPAPAPYFNRVFSPSELLKALDGADFVVVACPLTPETRGLIGVEELAVLHHDSFVVNVARGAIIDEEALVAALAQDRLGGAFLDAHAQEPLPQDHPLWFMDNVIITPHDSHASQLMGDRHVRLFCENLSRRLRGQDLLNVIDPSRGY